MRTLSTSKEDVLNAKKYQIYARLEVEDSTGGTVNLSALSSADWVEGLRWDWDLDQPCPQLVATLRRDHGPSTGQSLAPLDQDSTFNQNSTSGFAALVAPGRDFNLYTAVTAAGAAAPASSEYDFVFQGEVDEVQWAKSPMQVVARSKNMGRLVDRWLESSTQVYGSSSGVAVESVIEEVLNDWTDLSTTVLLTPVSPGFVVAPAYTPEKQPVERAVGTLAKLVGFNLHEVWSTSSTSWRIKFSEPNRTATSSDAAWTFGPEHYFDVRRMAVDRYDVRNAVSVIFGPSTNRQQVLVESTSSQDEFGRRWMEIEEASNSAIGTSSEAHTLASALLEDLKEPYATHEIEVPYWYPGELGDVYQFKGNGIHYSTDQYLAVYGISHELSRDRQRTRVRVRQQPAAYVLDWRRYRGGGNRVFAEVTAIHLMFTDTSSGDIVVNVVGSEASLGGTAYVTVGTNVVPANPSTSANDGSISLASARSGFVATGIPPTAGATYTAKAVIYDAAGIPGPVESEVVTYKDIFDGERLNGANPVFAGFIDLQGGEGATVLRLLSQGGGHIIMFTSSGLQKAAFGYAGAPVDEVDLQSDVDVRIDVSANSKNFILTGLPTSDPGVLGAVWSGGDGNLQLSTG